MTISLTTNFTVKIGDALIPVSGSPDADSLEDAALQAAVAARESLLNAKAVVTNSETGEVLTFSRRDMEEFWA